MIYSLPLHLLNETTAPDVVYYNYRTTLSTLASQVQLTHHLISFIQTGIKTVVLPHKTVLVPPNQFLLLSEGQCLMTEALSQQQEFHSQLLFFKHEIVQEFLLHHQIEVPMVEDSPNFQTLAYDAFVRHFVTSLDLVPNHHPIFLRHKVEEFLLYGYHQYGAKFFCFLKTPPQPALQQLVQVTQRAIYEKLTLEEMAFLCAMSVSTFKRHFALHYNTTPQSWLREQRLQRAAQLLRQGQYKPSELSEELGFQHHSSFTAAFKSRFGVTPSSYSSQF